VPRVRDARVVVPWPDGRIELAYRDWPGDGAPIVLLHGLASSSRIWDQLAARLAPRWRVLAFDQRGHGLSDKPDGGYDFATIVGDLRHALAALGVERPLVVGHSWGGNVALDFAVNGEPRPRALALIDGGFIELSRRMTWQEAEQRLRPPDLVMPAEEFRMRMRERLGPRWSAEWEGATMANFWVDDRGYLQRNLSIESHMKILAELYRHRPTELFGRVDCPVLMVPADPPAEAERDAAWRHDREELIALAERTLGGPPRARTVWMRETVHDVPLHRPDELAELLADLAAA
jgi:pimeloyl-ACP methyl ester carboxylesterase